MAVGSGVGVPLASRASSSLFVTNDRAADELRVAGSRTISGGIGPACRKRRRADWSRYEGRRIGPSGVVSGMCGAVGDNGVCSDDERPDGPHGVISRLIVPLTTCGWNPGTVDVVDTGRLAGVGSSGCNGGRAWGGIWVVCCSIRCVK